MNRSGLFFLIFAIAIALTFTWLNSTWLSYKGLEFSQKDKLVDYYLSDFTLLNTFPDGQMRYLVTGQHLVHQQSTGASRIFSPVLKAQDSDNGIITLTAKTAQQVKRNGSIMLLGKVNVDKKGNTLSENFELLTSDLTYNPIKKELSSDAELVLTSVNGNLQGVGFDTQLDDQELRIHKNVQAEFTPAK